MLGRGAGAWRGGGRGRRGRGEGVPSARRVRGGRRAPVAVDGSMSHGRGRGDRARACWIAGPGRGGAARAGGGGAERACRPPDAYAGAEHARSGSGASGAKGRAGCRVQTKGADLCGCRVHVLALIPRPEGAKWTYFIIQPGSLIEPAWITNGFTTALPAGGSKQARASCTHRYRCMADSALACVLQHTRVSTAASVPRPPRTRPGSGTPSTRLFHPLAPPGALRRSLTNMRAHRSMRGIAWPMSRELTTPRAFRQRVSDPSSTDAVLPVHA